MFFTDVFDEEVVDDESKRDGVSCMTPKAGSMGCLVITLFGKNFFEICVCHDTGLREAIHDPSDFDVDEIFFVDEVR